MAIGDSAGLLLRIRGDSTDAVRALNKVKKEAGDLKPNLDGLESALSGLASPAALVTAGVTALGAAAVAGGLALFNLAKSSAAFGSEIYNASIKTGLTTETISALKLASERTGVSMESLGTIVNRFSKVVGEAAQGSEKAIETLKRLGIEPQEAIDNLDGALGKVFARIQALPDPISRATVAQQAFGKAGTELLKVIDDFNGDLPGAIEKARQLGLVMSKEDAAAADEFGDQLDTLNAQLRGVGVTIGRELMPVFMNMAKEVSGFVARNKDEIRGWGETTANTLIGLTAYWNDLTAAVQRYGHFSGLVQLGNVPGTGGANLLQLLGPAGAALDLANKRGARQRIDTAPPAFGGAGGTGFELDPVTNTLRPRTQHNAQPTDALTNFDAQKKAQEEAKKAAEKAQKEAEELRKKQLQGQLGQIKAIQDAEQHALDRITDANKAAFEARSISSQQYLEQRLHDEEEFAKTAIADITKEYELRRKQENLSAEQLKALKIEEDNELQKVVDKRFEREEAAKKEASEQTKKISEEELEILKDRIDREIALFEAEADKRYAVAVQYAETEKKTEEDLAKFKQFLEEDTLQYRIGRLEIYAKALDKNSKEYLDLLNQIKILELKLEEVRAKNHVADKQRHDERIKSWNDYVQKVIEATEAEDALQQQRAEAKEKERKELEQDQFDSTGLGHIFTGAGLSLEDMLEPVDAAKELLESLGAVFSQVAQAVGEAVKAFVLFGNTGGSIRKFVAEVIASIATMAAVQAVWELAQGFAMLALNFFWPDPRYAAAAAMHFKAAAVYGAIAVVAAGVGRAVAGDSFKQQTASGGAGGSTGSNRQGSQNREGGAYSGLEDQTIEQGINAPALSANITLKFEEKTGILGQLFAIEVQRNGPLRQLIIDTANA